MPSTYTTRNRLEKQEPGENSNSWGTRLNGNMIDLVDFASDGITAFSLSGSKTLTANDGSADEARARVLHITGGTGGTVTIPNVEKAYLVRNASSGNVTIQTGTPTASAVVPAGSDEWVFCNGSASVFAAARRPHGALVVRSSGPAGDFSTPAAVPWDSETGGYDTASFHHTSTNNSRLTIPSGHEGYARLSAQLSVASLAAGQRCFAYISKNSSASFVGFCASEAYSDAALGVYINLSTPILPVAAADYFEVILTVESDTSVTVALDQSWFAIEMVA